MKQDLNKIFISLQTLRLDAARRGMLELALAYGRSAIIVANKILEEEQNEYARR